MKGVKYHVVLCKLIVTYIYRRNIVAVNVSCFFVATKGKNKTIKERNMLCNPIKIPLKKIISVYLNKKNKFINALKLIKLKAFKYPENKIHLN